MKLKNIIELKIRKVKQERSRANYLGWGRWTIGVGEGDNWGGGGGQLFNLSYKTKNCYIKVKRFYYKSF